MWTDMLKKKLNMNSVRHAYQHVMEKYNPTMFSLRSFSAKMAEEYKRLEPESRRKLTGSSFQNPLTIWLKRDGFIRRTTKGNLTDSFGESIVNAYYVKE
mgnify:CR=1 FL=1